MISKIVHSYGSLTIIRVFSRVFEFFLKTYLIRNLLDKEILGHMVYLDLIVTTSLHIAKSCLKFSYQKVQKVQNQEKNIKSGMNLMNYGIIITALSSMAVCAFQLYHQSSVQTDKRLLNLNYCIGIYGLSVVFQSIFQKYNVVNVIKYDYFRTAMIQMASFLPKTLWIFIASQLGLFQTLGILVFGLGQLLYCVLLMAISFYYSPYKTLLNQDINVFDQGSKQMKVYQIDIKTKQNVSEFSILSILKLFFQQFQKISLVIMDISEFSAVYSLISNLGSIVVRYLFAPLQQIVYNYFSRGDEKQSIKTLILLVKSLLIFSFLSLSFGYNYSEAFLAFLYGEKWVSSDATLAMQVYTVLLSVLGINGIMQAFLFAKGKESIKTYKYVSVIPSILFIFLSVIFIKMNYGTSSFFLANTFSMLVRILTSWNLQIYKHITLKEFLKEIKPSFFFFSLLIITFVAGHKSIGMKQIRFQDSQFLTLIFGGGMFCLNLLPIAYENKDILIKKIKKVLKKKVQ